MQAPFDIQWRSPQPQTNVLKQLMLRQPERQAVTVATVTQCAHIAHYMCVSVCVLVVATDKPPQKHTHTAIAHTVYTILYCTQQIRRSWEKMSNDTGGMVF